MPFELLSALAAYIPRDRVEVILYPDRPLPQDGVALIADISGFTPLTEALTQGLSADRGAEELTRALDSVFTPLIDQIHAFRGSVIKFGGDALIVWYGREARGRRSAVIRRAITSAWRMQQAMQLHGRAPTPVGEVVLKMKIGLTYGPVKRFNLGLPEYGYEDVLAGTTLDRMAEAEHHAEPGDIVTDAATAAYLPQAITVAAWRDNFAVIGRLLRPARPKYWPPLRWPAAARATLSEQLAAYVPGQIYQILAAGRDQVAELKPVISLFIQFHGIDYDADPEVENKLQTYFATAQRVVARYDGRLNRLITGDKGSLIHVVFGAPRTVEEQETRAVRCALDLQQACGGLGFITMQRTGITVGRVFAGPVGAPYRHDYTTMGDSINLSARLMQSAADDQILIEEAVRARLGSEAEVADLGEIQVKGKSEPISVFAALSFQPVVARAGQQLYHGPIFGRAGEIERLLQRLDRLQAGRGSVITLVGEVGLGKTHLLAHLRDRAPVNVTWASALCLAYGQTFTGYLFFDILRDLLQLPASQGAEATSQHLRRVCADLFGPARVEATFPYLARFMDLPLAPEFARRVEGLAGESLRWQLFEIIRELVLLSLDSGPLVLAMDDLQWADPTSLQLVETILPLTFNYPLLLLLAMRPERESRAWTLRQQIRETLRLPEQHLDLTLSSLDYDPAAALVAHLTPALPEQTIVDLVEKSGGNPLFLIEIVRMLHLQGLLSPEADLSRPALEALQLPDSVQGLLLAQIDRLAVEARHALQMAAVIGETFFYRVLETLAGGEQDLETRIATLEQETYIWPDEPTDLGLTYNFRHALIQESAYSTLLYEHRRAYHRQVAKALETLFPGHLARQARLLSFHYERAGELDPAIYYYLQAADQARLLYANEEAEALYRKVLALLDEKETGRAGSGEAAAATSTPERRAKTYLKLAQVRANALDFDGAQSFYNMAFDLWGQIGDGGPSRPETAPGEQPAIRLGVFEQGPYTLDPGLFEIAYESEILKELFEGLVELDNELNVIPAMARRWTVAEGGIRYRFELRQNLRWSDGTPLTAHDFVFAWRRNLHPDTAAGLAQELYVVKGAEAFHRGLHNDPAAIGIQALNDLTLEITLNVPAGYFLYLLAVPVTFPQPAHVIQARGQAWSRPENLACNGPFRIARWQAGRQISLEKNPYYGGLQAGGNLERVELAFIEPSLEHYLSRRVDWCRVEGEPDLPHRYPEEVLLTQHLETYFLGFACHCPPFQQRLVRQAFAQSIDKNRLVAEIWGDVHRTATGGVVPPGMPGHSPEIGLSFDPSAARTLLRAGFDPARTLPRLTLGALGGFRTTPRFLQENWQEHLGVEVELVDLPFEEMLAGMRSGAIQLALGGWSVDYPDPDNVLRGLFHSASPANYFGWQNSQFDQLVERAAASTNPPDRLALYHQADRILVGEEAAIAPLYYRQEYGLLRAGFRLSGDGKIIRGDTLRFKNISVEKRS